MKIMKKTLCVFLSALMLFSALSVSLVAFAAGSASDEMYEQLAYSFFNYTRTTHGSDTIYTVNQDENGYPSKSLVGVMDQYSVTNESGEYTYEDEQSGPIRSVSYTHKVTAKDNSQGVIKGALTQYLGIADTIISSEYGVGNYTIPMVTDEVSKNLEFYRDADGKFLFLDGYTYLVDGLGNLVGRSDDKTYEVKNFSVSNGKVVSGDIVYFENDGEEESWRDQLGQALSSENIRDQITNGNIDEVTLFGYCNVNAVLQYFSGNCTTVNSGNWFHKYEFVCSTDIETVLTTENFSRNNIRIQGVTVDWSMNRSFDDSGTKAQYYNNGYVKTDDPTRIDSTRATLSNLQGLLDNYFNTYYQTGVLDNKTNNNLINTDYPAIMQYFDVFNSISNKAKIAVFGDDAYSYMNLVTQLTPISDTTELDKYLPTHTYEKYYNTNGTNVTYKVTTDKVTTIVSTIDNLMGSDSVGTIIKSFVDFTDPDSALYIDPTSVLYGQSESANSAMEVLQLIIQKFVFDDSIINMLLKTVYPMVTNLLDENLTDDFINNATSGYTFLLNWVTENDGWQKLIYAILMRNNMALTPAGVAYIMQANGYSGQFPEAFADLKAAKGGASNEAKDANGTTDLGDFYAVGVEGDEYCGQRWKDVDFDNLYWGINGDRAKFQNALCCILSPLAPLLACLLGNQKLQLFLGDLMFDLFLVLRNFTLYNDILLPILEALGIPTYDYMIDENGDMYPDSVNSQRCLGLRTGSQFYSLAGTYVNNMTAANCSSFLNNGLLTPLLDWVMNIVLNDPISTILNIVPNLSYYLTSGALQSSIKGLEIPIVLRIGLESVTVEITKLKIADLLGDKLDFLNSLQGIIDLIGIKVDTGIPIVGYHAEDDTKVYKPGMAGYDEATMTVGVTTAYKSATGDLSSVQDSEYAEEITGLNSDGSYNIPNCILNQVGWANAAGSVVTERSDLTIGEYTTPVYEYYQYTETDPVTEEQTTYKVTTLPATVTEYTLVQDIVFDTATAKIPSIMDYKLQACGTLKTGSSIRTNAFSMTAKDGSNETWAANQRKYIDLDIGGNKTGGLVLLFIFRYLFSALQYRAYDADMGDFSNDYTLLDAFGLGDTLSKNLFYGFKLQDIIDNISLNPDAAIASLYELFYKNETGSVYEMVNGIMQAGTPYVYDMTPVDYHTTEIMDAAEAHNDYNYGTSVLYTEYWTKENSEYVVDNLDDLVDSILAMIKVKDVASIGELLEGLLDDYLFNNDLLSKIASTIFGLIDNLEGVDLSSILNAALGVDYSKKAIYNAMRYEFEGTTTDVMSRLLAESNAGVSKYSDSTFYMTGIDENTGEDTQIAYDWGYNNPEVTAKYTNRQIFIRAISALASPFAILVKYLFCGEDLSVLGVVNIPGYDGYQYAWIPFMEAFGATSDLVSYNSFYQKVYAGSAYDTHDGSADRYVSKEIVQNCDAFYYSFIPAFSFVEKLLADPVSTLLTLIPNLAFFISVGGLNEVVNNFVHFAYVLLDILQPVFDVYPLANSFLSNLNIGDFVLNLAIPLDFDFNSLINTLIESLVGSALSFDIENKKLPIGMKDVEKTEPVLDGAGNPTYVDTNGNGVQDVDEPTITQTVTVQETAYATGTLKISLPYIDFSTLCAGTIQRQRSITGNYYIFLNSAGGADLLTLVLRLVLETLFYKENANNLADFLSDYCLLDDDNDSDDLLHEIFTYFNDKANSGSLPDQILMIIFVAYQYLLPIANVLGDRFKGVDFSIVDLFNSIGAIGGINNIQGSDFMNKINALLNAGDPTTDTAQTMGGFKRIIQLLKEFFAKIKKFFQSMFSKG